MNTVHLENDAITRVPRQAFMKSLTCGEMNAIFQPYAPLVQLFGITLPVNEKTPELLEQLGRVPGILHGLIKSGAAETSAHSLCARLVEIEALTEYMRISPHVAQTCGREVEAKAKEEDEDGEHRLSQRTLSVRLCMAEKRSPAMSEAVAIAVARCAQQPTPKTLRMVHDGYPDKAMELAESKPEGKIIEGWRLFFETEVLTAFLKHGYAPACYSDICGDNATWLNSTAEAVASFLRVYVCPRASLGLVEFVVEHGGWKDIVDEVSELKVLKAVPLARDLISVDFGLREVRIQSLSEWHRQVYAKALTRVLLERGFMIFPQDYLLTETGNPEAEKWRNAIAAGKEHAELAHNVLKRKRDGEPLDVSHAPRGTLPPALGSPSLPAVALDDYIREDLPVCMDRDNRRADTRDDVFWEQVAVLIKAGKVSRNRLYGEFSPRVASFVDTYIHPSLPGGEESIESCWYDKWGNRWEIKDVAGELYPHLGSRSVVPLPIARGDVVCQQIDTDALTKKIRDVLAPLEKHKVWKALAGGSLYRIDCDSEHGYYLYLLNERGLDEEARNTWADEPDRRAVLFLLEPKEQSPYLINHASRNKFQTRPLHEYVTYQGKQLVVKRDITEGLEPADFHVPKNLKHEYWEGPRIDSYADVEVLIAGVHTTIRAKGKERRYDTFKLLMFRRSETAQKHPIFRRFCDVHETFAEQVVPETGMTLKQLGVDRGLMDRLNRRFREFFFRTRATTVSILKPAAKTKGSKDTEKPASGAGSRPRYFMPALKRVEERIGSENGALKFAWDEDDKRRISYGGKPAGTARKTSEPQADFHGNPIQ